jgi:katanin p60 ATPase-containing subunit A1
MVVLVNPSNPTGAVTPPNTVRRFVTVLLHSNVRHAHEVVYPLCVRLQRLCEEKGVWLVSDEAYEYFVFDGAELYSPVGPNVISIVFRGTFALYPVHVTTSCSLTSSYLYSMSKSYGMAGWRIGYMAYPPDLQVKFLTVSLFLFGSILGFVEAGHGLPSKKHLDKVQDTIPINACQLSQALAYSLLSSAGEEWVREKVRL